MKWIFTVLLFHVCLNLKAQQDTAYTPDHLYSPQGLHADLIFVKNTLEKAHPSLYRYSPKDTIDLKFESADKQLNRPMTESEFWSIAEPCVSAVRSGHTELYHSTNYVDWYNKKWQHVLPFTIFIDGDHIYLNEFLKTNGLYKGAEIVAIEGRTVASILKDLKACCSSDGYGDRSSKFYLETMYFNEFYAAVYGMKPQYVLTFLDKKHSMHTVTVDAMKFHYGKDVVKYSSAEYPDPPKLARDVHYFNDISTAVLQLHNLSYDDYLKFHQHFFESIADKGCQNLIIDLRGNLGGGEYVTDDLLRYLVEGKSRLFNFNGVTAATDNFNFHEALIKKGSFDVSTLKMIKTADNRYRDSTRTYNFESNYIQLFRGQVYVLVDKGTYSAATLFLTALRTQRKVTIIGDESGGTAAGTDGFAIVLLRLPTTKLILRLPLFWGEFNTGRKDDGRGIIPDIAIVPTITDRVNDNDVVMQKVKELIGKK